MFALHQVKICERLQRMHFGDCWSRFYFMPIAYPRNFASDERKRRGLNNKETLFFFNDEVGLVVHQDRGTMAIQNCKLEKREDGRKTLNFMNFILIVLLYSLLFDAFSPLYY